VKLEIAAITSSQALERGLREVSPALDELSSRVGSLRGLLAPQRYLLVSLVDRHVAHFEDVTSRRAVLQVEVGYDATVFQFPLDRSRILRHLADRASFAVAKCRLPLGDKEAIAGEVQSWLDANECRDLPG